MPLYLHQWTQAHPEPAITSPSAPATKAHDTKKTNNPLGDAFSACADAHCSTIHSNMRLYGTPFSEKWLSRLGSRKGSFHHFRTCKPVNYWGAHRRSRISPPMASIPKGLRHLAQGCEARATLGNRAKIVSNPNRGFALSPAPRHVRPRPKPKAQSLPFPFPAQYRSA